MNPIPKNHSALFDDPDLSLVPFTTRLCGPKGQEASFYLSDLSPDANLDLDLNTRVVPPPQTPQGTHFRNVIPVRHPTQCHICPGTIPQVAPQTTSLHPQFGTPAAVAPQPTFCAFEGAHSFSPNPSLSPSHPGRSSSASLDSGTPQVQVWQGTIPQVRSRAKTSSLSTNPQLNFHPPVDHQLTSDTFDDVYALLPQPSSSLLSTSIPVIDYSGGKLAAPLSSVDHQLTFDTFDDAYALLPQPSSSLLSTSIPAIDYSGGELAAPLSSVQNVSFPMASGSAPFQPSLTPVVPISGSPFSVSMPIVPMGSAPAATSPPTTTFARQEPRQVPTSRGLYPECVRPLVRVDNIIEWVRPDVMKMVVYFNFSSNAEAEAHSSWEA